MVDHGDGPTYDLRALSRELFDKAKHWRTAELLFRLSVFGVGVAVILLSLFPKYAPFLIAFLTIMAEICLLYSDANKRVAEGILRKLDGQESFGWPISKAEESDFLMQCPAGLRRKYSSNDAQEQYFASQREFGPRRALENMQESAWWSKYLARRVAHYYLALTIVLSLASIGALLVSIETIQNFDVLSNIGRVVTSTFMLTFSLGLIKFMLGYYQFSASAAQIVEQAGYLLESDGDNSGQAIKVMYEYQLARAAAPLLPSWLWKLMRHDLNDLWKMYRCSNPKGAKK